ncbi:uncharacterized protein [Parasteatoda tepidariorum]|uniref:uncharacterized protein n=1 Tax=Parasteatoda tepidariorum TaxID=114398 RepID=UPI0039BC953D
MAKLLKKVFGKKERDYNCEEKYRFWVKKTFGPPKRIGKKDENEMSRMYLLIKGPEIWIPAVPPEIRLQRINCMESFVTPQNPWRMHQSVQYCAYFAHTTRFGDTMRRGENIVNYDPWQYSPVLNTDIACSYTRIRPYQYSKPTIYVRTFYLFI